MDRRHFLGFTAASCFGRPSSAPRPAAAQTLKEIRIGWQKAGIFPASSSAAFSKTSSSPAGSYVKWVEFPFGPPMMEALNTGNIDYGYVGDSPRSSRRLRVQTFSTSRPSRRPAANEALIVPANSPIQTLAELKGKKIGRGQGTQARTTPASPRSRRPG